MNKRLFCLSGIPGNFLGYYSSANKFRINQILFNENISLYFAMPFISSAIAWFRVQPWITVCPGSLFFL
jgi:hypothetical protein